MKLWLVAHIFFSAVMVKQAMEVVPKEVAFAAAKLDAFNRNRYRIETTGASFYYSPLFYTTWMHLCLVEMCFCT